MHSVSTHPSQFGSGGHTPSESTCGINAGTHMETYAAGVHGRARVLGGLAQRRHQPSASVPPYITEREGITSLDEPPWTSQAILSCKGTLLHEEGLTRKKFSVLDLLDPLQNSLQRVVLDD